MKNCLLLLISISMFMFAGNRCVAQGLNKETRILVSEAINQIGKKEWAKAEETLKRIIEIDANSRPAWFRLGICQQKQNKHQSSIESFRKVFGPSGMGQLAMFHAACSSANLGKTEDALKYLEKAISAGFDDHNLVAKHSALSSIHKLPRFQHLLKRCKDNAKAGNTNQLKVAILVYNGVELLDFAGPGEVFSISRNKKGKPAFNVWTVGLTKDPITSNGFLKVTPNFSIGDCPKIDILVIPGGSTLGIENDKRLINWIKKVSIKCTKTMSVCTGVFLLERAELLKGLEVTTHWRAISNLEKLAGDRFQVVKNRRFVDTPKIITSAGVSAGIDAALQVVKQLHGPESAKLTARQMQYQQATNKEGK